MYEPAIRRALRLARGGYAYGGSPYDIYSGIQGLQPFQFNPAMPSTVDNIPSGQQGPSYMKPAYLPPPAPVAEETAKETSPERYEGGNGNGGSGGDNPMGGPGSNLGTPGNSNFGNMFSGANLGYNAANMVGGLALGALGPVGMGLSAANTISGIFGGPTLASMFGLSKDTANVNAVNGLKADPLTQKSYAPVSPSMLAQSKAANDAVNTTAAAQTNAQTASSQQQAADRSVNNAAAMSLNMNSSDLGQLSSALDSSQAAEKAANDAASPAAAAAAEAATAAADQSNGNNAPGSLGGGPDSSSNSNAAPGGDSNPGSNSNDSNSTSTSNDSNSTSSNSSSQSQGSGNDSGLGDGKGYARGGHPHANNSANNAIRLARLIHSEMRSDPLFDRKIQSILSRL
jgi:hypothetical protein